ncbi:hypothetical protein NMY22_g1441 [Coprinellus aureogranulatus]|nr:hypothetical protein NMY22_g1441 [Coprinellus aureogranulatus]
MVLKRKRGNEWVTVNPSSSQASAGPSSQPPIDVETSSPTKRARRALPTEWLDNAPEPEPAPIPKTPTTKRRAKASPTKAVELPPMPMPFPSMYAQDEAGPSSSLAYAAAIPSSSQLSVPAKRGRKKKDPNAPVPEKRQAMFKKHCPQNIMERLERVRTQTFFMVDRRRNDGELREEFSVLGSTGNIYTVMVDKLPKCDCPDARKGNHCKHILFIMTKVLQVPTTSHMWYQKALLTSELEEIFANAPAAPNAVTNRRVQEAYARATGKANATPVAEPSSKKRMPQEEDDCPICYESMFKVAEAKLAFCEECGNALHSGCFAQWKQTSQRSGKELTCVYCRSKWYVASAASKSGIVKPGGYLNLASAAGLSPVRDTSSYYQGPRRGQRGGMVYYDDD